MPVSPLFASQCLFPAPFEWCPIQGLPNRAIMSPQRADLLKRITEVAIAVVKTQGVDERRRGSIFPKFRTATYEGLTLQLSEVKELKKYLLDIWPIDANKVFSLEIRGKASKLRSFKNGPWVDRLLAAVRAQELGLNSAAKPTQSTYAALAKQALTQSE